MDLLPSGAQAVSISPTESRLVITNFDMNVQAGEYHCIATLAGPERSRVVFVSPKGVCAECKSAR